jgi:hypothetical protein
MTFRFYITNINDGTVAGTNDESLANDYAQSQDYFVIDTTNNLWLQPDGQTVEIQSA